VLFESIALKLGKVPAGETHRDMLAPPDATEGAN